MNCQCGKTVKYILCKDGKPAYVCANNRCRFHALTPLHCEGYRRILPNGSTPIGLVTILRFEALLRPLSNEMAIFMVSEGKPIEEREDVLEIVENKEFEPMWHTIKEGYIYPSTSYRPLISKLKILPDILIEEIPEYFFRSIDQANNAVKQHSDQVEGKLSQGPDEEDIVYIQLRPFQRVGVDFIISRGGRGMIADDMGLGKTVQAIAVAHHYRHEWPLLVLCPMSLMENWAKELNKFCGIPFSRIGILQGTKARAEETHQIVIVSYNSIKCLSESPARYKVVILDESHYIKSSDSKRSQSALAICKEANRVLLLSGTPAMSRPIELFPQIQAIQPFGGPTKNQYAARYCNGYISRFGIDISGHSHVDELHVLLQKLMIRRTKKELGAELPSKSRQLLYICITAKERKSLEKQVVALRHSVSAFTPSGPNTQMLSRAPNAFELKIATANAKIPAVQDYVESIVEQHIESKEKIIFFAHHQCMMDALKAAVEAVRPKQPIDYIFISGDTPGQQREHLANHFRTVPSCNVAILSMQSSGTGHNFTCASTVVFTELDWNPSTHLQCEDRVHRIGQSHSCTIKYLLADGTSDSVIWPLLQSKLTVTTSLLENDKEIREKCQLGLGADTQKVNRRDISPTNSSQEKKQGTLDGFVKVSQPKNTPVTGRGSKAENTVIQLSPSNEDNTPLISIDIIKERRNKKVQPKIGLTPLSQKVHQKESIVSPVPVTPFMFKNEKASPAQSLSPVKIPIQTQIDTEESRELSDSNDNNNNNNNNKTGFQRTIFRMPVRIQLKDSASHTSSGSPLLSSDSVSPITRKPESSPIIRKEVVTFQKKESSIPMGIPLSSPQPSLQTYLAKRTVFKFNEASASPNAENEPHLKRPRSESS